MNVPTEHLLYLAAGLFGLGVLLRIGWCYHYIDVKNNRLWCRPLVW